MPKQWRGRVTTKTINVELKSGNTNVEIKTLDKNMKGLGATSDKTASSISNVTPVAAGVSTALDKSSKSASKFSQVAGQAGFQIQDFIVQVQGGTSALTAFTQQAPQLAGAFGPGGAVVGAFLALAGVIGGVLFKSLLDTKTAMDKLKEAIESAKNIVSTSKDGVIEFSDEIAKLAKLSERAAQLT